MELFKTFLQSKFLFLQIMFNYSQVNYDNLEFIFIYTKNSPKWVK
jgi:hypothetical protein